MHVPTKKRSERRLPDFMKNPVIQAAIHALKTCTSAEDLDKFATVHNSVQLPLTYVFDRNDRLRRLTLLVGFFHPGKTLWKKITCENKTIYGVAIGILLESPHQVVVVPGGGVYLCRDPADMMPENVMVPDSFCRVLDEVLDIGIPANFVECSGRDKPVEITPAGASSL